jgi:hypothetical protein
VKQFGGWSTGSEKRKSGLFAGAYVERDPTKQGVAIEFLGPIAAFMRFVLGEDRAIGAGDCGLDRRET